MSPPGQDVRILDLPSDLLARILQLVAGARRGKLPVETWPSLSATCTAFRAALYSSVRTADLASAPAPRALLAGPLRRCPALRTLNLSSCAGVADADVVEFCGKAHDPARARLRAVALTVCGLQTDASVVALARASGHALQACELAGCDRHRHSARSAVRLSADASMQRDVPCRALTNASFVALTTFCPSLAAVTVANATAVDDSALRAIAGLPALTDLILRRLPLVTDAGIRFIANGSSRTITRLSLLSVNRLGDNAVVAIASGPATANSLRLFALTFNYAATDIGIARLVESVPTLEELQCDHCTHVSDTWTSSAAVASLGGSISGGLTRISLRHVGLILTDRGLCDLAGTRLRALNLGFVPSVNAETLTTLLSAAPLLTILVLDACANVDDESCAVIAQFENLSTLDLSWCSKLTTRGVRAITSGVAGAHLRRLSIGPVVEVPLSSGEAAAGRDNTDNVQVVGGQPGTANAAVHANGDASTTAVVAASASTTTDGGDTSWHLEPPQVTPPSAMLLPLVLQQTAGHDPEGINTGYGGREDVAGGEGAGGGRGKSRHDTSLYDIGRKCVQLRELVLCGAVHASTVEWLRRNTRARIDYMEGGLCSSLYTEEENSEDVTGDVL
jgi:hypothetical protein